MIYNLDNINNMILKEKLNLLVVSYGGSGYNILVKYLEKIIIKLEQKDGKKNIMSLP